MTDPNKTPRRPLAAALALLLPGVAVGQTAPDCTFRPDCTPTTTTPSIAKPQPYKTVVPAECVNVPQPRHYTVAEIDRMRAAVMKQLGFADRGSWNDIRVTMLIEMRLQTAIAAGIGPEKLER